MQARVKSGVVLYCDCPTEYLNLLSMLSKTHYRTMLISCKRWRKCESDRCPLCGERQTILHVLYNCRVVLLFGRYTWRHNAILKVISEYINAGLKDGWEMTADLNGQYSLPVPLSHFTAARPDIAIWNKTVNRIYFLELTIAFDDYMQNASDRKKRK